MVLPWVSRVRTMFPIAARPGHACWSCTQPISVQTAPIRVFQKQPNVVMQGALIAFQGDHIIASLLDDLGADRALALPSGHSIMLCLTEPLASLAHRVDSHDSAFDGEHMQQLGDGYDLVGFFRHLDLAEHKALTGSKG